MPGPVVGIIANPISARDIRRVISYAGGLQITDRANMVLRILAGLAAAGVEKTVIMPENAGLRGHLMRALTRSKNAGEGQFPEIETLDMPVTGEAADSARAAGMMREMGVAAIVVLGGDGTHRIVVANCGDVPIAGVSSGTNNAFPETREPTVTGLGVGLAVTGAVPPACAFAANKQLDVAVNGALESALVDVAFVQERFVGSRAIWKPDGFRELFVTFGSPDGIGMSSIAGLVAPVSRSDRFGRRIVFDRSDTASFAVNAPIAPGLIAPVGIDRVETLAFDQPVIPETTAGSIAFDGEREVTFGEDDTVTVTLRESAFRTINIAACMAHAAEKRTFRHRTPNQRQKHRRRMTMAATKTATRASDNPFPLEKDDLLSAYRTMRTIREFEDRLHVDFARGGIPGFVHLYAGEEASATGIMMHLTDEDRIASTHRGHGHCIAKGVSVHEMMGEIYGKATGACRGKGGSMHIADLSKGMMGANGILGAGAPLACGAALAAKKLGHKGIGISFVGDGASNQGMFLESLNLAAVWELPTIFVVENNGYAESTAVEWAVASDSYVDRANGFGLPGVTVDGTDFFAVHEAAGEMIRRAREGGGPSLLECKMIRFHGHFEGDAQTYRADGEIEDIRKNRDCIRIFTDRVREAGVIGQDELDAIDGEVTALIDDAVAEAIAAPLPGPAELHTDVYVKY